MKMKSLKRSVIFYSVVCILFLMGELMMYFLNHQAMVHSPGAEIMIGLFIPAILFVFCCIGISSAFVGYFSIEKYYWKAYIPFLIVVGTVLLYIIIPKSEYSIWYKVIKFYFTESR